MQGRGKVVLVSLAALVALLAGLALATDPFASDTGTGGEAPTPAHPPPSIVAIQTDDQAVGDLRFMPRTRRLIVQRGVRFSRYYASYSLCCPSRTTMVTGQYAHNHRVLSNAPPKGAFDAFVRHGLEDRDLPLWLQEAGYETALVGKFLNGYGMTEGLPADYVPPGWDEWDALVGNTAYRYWDYTLNENGTLTPKSGEYQTNTLTDLALEFLGRQSPNTPFFLSFNTAAPHGVEHEPTAPPALFPHPETVAAIATSPCHSRHRSTRRTSTTSQASSGT